VTFCIKICW